MRGQRTPPAPGARSAIRRQRRTGRGSRGRRPARPRRLRPAVAALLAIVAIGCGGSSGRDRAGGEEGRIVVAAAASLAAAFERYAERLGGDVRLLFAGSDDLAAQIRQGVKPDVYAAASATLPEQLHAERLVEEPVVFAANRLVIAAPAEGSELRRFEDLTRPGVTIAIGAQTAPIGAYARQALGRLPAAQERAILANVRSEEPDVKGIVGKLTQGAVDAGFVYATDVAATGGALRAIALPDAAQPAVAYAAAVVKGTRNPRAARRFIDGLLEGAGARALRDAGFEPPVR